jgi:hypothetical protein
MVCSNNLHSSDSILKALKPVYVELVDNWFLKLVLYYFNGYILKNPLSTCSR